jgi:hypothetical protein
MIPFFEVEVVSIISNRDWKSENFQQCPPPTVQEKAEYVTYSTYK